MHILSPLFDGTTVRRIHDQGTGTWWFSVLDFVQVLTDSSDASRDWRDLRRKLARETGSGRLFAGIVPLKMSAADGSLREMDCATAPTLLRLVQSLSSPRAETIKCWLAGTGLERMQELADPARVLDRARESWRQLGRSDTWIRQRMAGHETHSKLVDYWGEHGLRDEHECALLTEDIHREWAGLTMAEHKAGKGLLQSQNLRDHMSEAELIFTALAELSTRQIAESRIAVGLLENQRATQAGGRIACRAREQLERQTGRSMVSDNSHLRPDANPAT
ncbi:MAG: hypothetical protein WA917_09350 [Comamonas sp.]|nr:hypothetical protein [Comamonas sp.]